MLGLEGIERSQKKLYRSLQAELSLFDKQKNKELKAYELSFKKNFPKKFRVSSRPSLLKAIKQSRVVLVGDFHPFRQSQKCFLRLIESFKGKKIAIALECFQSQKQNALDDYLKGHITLDELREESNFEHYWPFSWKNYREILQFAKKNRIKLLALNIEGNKSSLNKRDQTAASIISSYLAGNPKFKIFALYGELHLAQRHLPFYLKKTLGEKSTLVVHQNEPSLYWKLSKKINTQKVDVLYLRSQEFCIMNAVPWVKLRSYLDWLEGSPEEEDHFEQEPSELILEYAKFLKTALQLSGEIRETFEVISAEQIKPKSFSLNEPNSAEKLFFRHSSQLHRTNLIPKKNIILLPLLSLNSIAEAASFLVWISQLKKIGAQITLETESLVMQYCIGYLGSKIINPKRKCNEVKDLIQHKVKKRFQMALFILSPLLPEIGKTKEINLHGLEKIEACRIAGYILGERLYLSLSRGEPAIRFVRKIFLTSTAKKAWSAYQLQAISTFLKKRPHKARKKNDQF